MISTAYRTRSNDGIDGKDSVGLYLDGIAKTPLLTAVDEVELARRIEAGLFARAILEGIAVEMKGSLDLVEQFCGEVSAVSVSGGMTRSDLFNQIQSDVFDRPVVRFGSNEATSLGAWIAGVVAVGMETSYPAAFARAEDPGSVRRYQPEAANRARYAAQVRRSRALYQALAAPEFRKLMAED